jgi:hypothetical protein
VISGSGDLVPTCKWILRRWFDEGNYEGRAREGNLLVEGRDRSHPPDSTRNMPDGTQTFRLTYIDLHGRVVARAIWDRVPGEPARRPDPKFLRGADDTLYIPFTDPEHHCEHCRPERGDPDYPYP